MYSQRKAIIGLIGVLIVLVNPLSLVYASQPYMGAYFDETKASTIKVIFDAGFPLTDGTDLDSGNNIQSVISVAGGDGTSPTGWCYQNTFGLVENDDVKWCPQTYYGSSQEYARIQATIGDSDYVFFFGRIDYDDANGKIKYQAWTYEDEWDVEHEVYTNYTWTHDIPDGEANFIIGKETTGGYTYYYVQGVSNPTK